jgi:hypothetical protein
MSRHDLYGSFSFACIWHLLISCPTKFVVLGGMGAAPTFVVRMARAADVVAVSVYHTHQFSTLISYIHERRVLL